MSNLYVKAKMALIEKALGIATLSEEHLLHRLEEIYWRGCKDGLNVNLADTQLYHRVNELMAILGADGEVTTRTAEVGKVMDTLYAIDGGVYQDEKKQQKQIEALNEEIARLKIHPQASGVHDELIRHLQLMPGWIGGEWPGTLRELLAAKAASAE